MSPLGLHLAGIGLVVCGVSAMPLLAASYDYDGACDDCGARDGDPCSSSCPSVYGAEAAPSPLPTCRTCGDAWCSCDDVGDGVLRWRR